MTEILNKVFYDGYYILKTRQTHPPGITVLSEIAYNLNDEYIGDPKTAKYICVDKKIVPELATPTNSVCSIGFNEKDQKWYGWSHRAIWGFTIGSKVTKGASGYRTSDKQELLKELKDDYRFNSSDGSQIKETSKGWIITVPAEVPTDSDCLEDDDKAERTTKPYVYEYILGRGEWAAKTLEDAKQMAVDFAESVS